MSDGGKCGDCRHWSRDRVFPGQPSSCWGRCEMAEGSDGVAERRGTLAYASDCSGYAASLNTNEKFSCVQFASVIRADHDGGDEA